MVAYALFVKHHVLPSDFFKLSAEEKAAAIAFLYKEIKDEKKARAKQKSRR